MAYPSNVSTGTVTGTLIDAAGRPLTGAVEFTPNPAWVAAASAEPAMVILPKPIVTGLAADGTFSVELIATTDPDTDPTGWAYQVRLTLAGIRSPEVFSVQVPPGVVTDLAEAPRIPEDVDASMQQWLAAVAATTTARDQAREARDEAEAAQSAAEQAVTAAENIADPLVTAILEDTDSDAYAAIVTTSGSVAASTAATAIAGLDGTMVRNFTDTTERDTEVPTPTEGMVCSTGTGSSLQYWACRGGAWVDMLTVIGGSAYGGVYDTGWVALTLLNDATGAVKIRRIGPQVWVSIEALVVGSSGTVANIPSELQSTGETGRGFVSTTGTATFYRAAATTTVTIAGSPGSSPLYGAIHYLR